MTIPSPLDKTDDEIPEDLTIPSAEGQPSTPSVPSAEPRPIASPDSVSREAADAPATEVKTYPKRNRVPRVWFEPKW